MRIFQFQLHYDTNYGINKRRGWSVVINGSVMVQFWREPVSAVIYSIYLALTEGRS